MIKTNIYLLNKNRINSFINTIYISNSTPQINSMIIIIIKIKKSMINNITRQIIKIFKKNSCNNLLKINKKTNNNKIRNHFNSNNNKKKFLKIFYRIK